MNQRNKEDNEEYFKRLFESMEYNLTKIKYMFVLFIMLFLSLWTLDIIIISEYFLNK